MNLHRFLFAFISLSALCCRSHALKCYQCSSEIHGDDCPKDGSEMKPKYIVECKGSCGIHSFWFAVRYVERMCSVSKKERNLCSGSWLTEPCFCNTHLCNINT